MANVQTEPVPPSIRESVYCDIPVPEGSFRILFLIPDEDPKAPIQCRIVKYPLPNPGRGAHPYEALSYVWGSENNQRDIYVQPTDSAGINRRLLVTANLYAALLHLRHNLLERALWIDAICINQKDNDEKGRQVQSMAKIYAGASCVIVWLGEAAANSDQALEYIRRAASNSTASDRTGPDWIASKWVVSTRALKAASNRAAPSQPSVDEIGKQSILTLLGQPWFERIWVRLADHIRYGACG